MTGNDSGKKPTDSVTHTWVPPTLPIRSEPPENGTVHASPENDADRIWKAVQDIARGG